MIITIYKKVIESSFFISFIFVSHIFLWKFVYSKKNTLFETEFTFFQLKFLLLILLIPAFVKFLIELKNKDYKFIKYFSLFCGFLFLHTGLNLYFDNQQITQVVLVKTVLLILIFIIAYYYYAEIVKNLDLIINIFLILFLLSCFVSFFDYQKDSPYFCGGVPDIFGLTNKIHGIDPDTPAYANLLENKIAVGNYVKISFREFIFLENSHLGMIAPGVLAYTIFRLFKNFNKFNLITTLLFFIICLFKSSTTLLMGFPIILIGIILFNFKQIPKKVIMIYLIISAGCIYTLTTSYECKNRFNPIYGATNFFDNKNYPDMDLIHDTKPKYKSGSISSAVTFGSLRIAKESLLNKPFGWGANRYIDAYFHYNNIDFMDKFNISFYQSKADLFKLLPNDQHASRFVDVKLLNSSDASNNIVKIIVEFGVFGIFIFLILFLYAIKKSIPIEHKLFFIPIIGTQMLRGAGYFNSGFLLIALLIIFSYLEKSTFVKNKNLNHV